MEIKNLRSKYIPVFSEGYVTRSDVAWWREKDPFIYKRVLLNLDTIDKEDVPKLEFPDDMFFLTDSGGFQVIKGQCNYDWETSLVKQIELGASKIFSFDKPPVEQVATNVFIGKEIGEYKKQVEENLDVAIKQSEWLQKKYPNKVKDFCYVLHANSKEMLDYNMMLIEKKI